MEGFLYKRISEESFSRWRKRWATLSDSELQIFEERGKRLREIILISAIESVEVGDEPFQFVLRCLSVRLTFRAPTPAICAEWLRALTLRVDAAALRGAATNRAFVGGETLASLCALEASFQCELGRAEQRAPSETLKALRETLAKHRRAFVEAFSAIESEEREIENARKLIAFIGEETQRAEIARSLTLTTLVADDCEWKSAVSTAAEQFSLSKTAKESLTSMAEISQIQCSETRILTPTFDAEYSYISSPLLHDYLRENAAFRRYPIGEARSPSAPRFAENHRAPSLRAAIAQWALGGAAPLRALCPISLTALAAEFLAHERHFRTANRLGGQTERALHVIGGLWLHYAAVEGRRALPYIPILGETWELVRGDLRVLCEAVCARPPTVAYHCETDDYVVEGVIEYRPRNSFLQGANTEIVEQRALTLKSTGETFLVEPPRVEFSRGIATAARLTIDGRLSILNCLTQTRVAVELSQSDGALRATGEAFDAATQTAFDIWSNCKSEFCFKNAAAATPTRLLNADATEPPFCLTPFGEDLCRVKASELCRVAPTDARLRSDIYAHFNADFEIAELESAKIALESAELPFDAKWFSQCANAAISYKFSGKYWRFRESGDWPNATKILFSPK